MKNLKKVFVKSFRFLTLLIVPGILAVSCASAPKEYRVELIESAEEMDQAQGAANIQKQEEESGFDTYEKFPYIGFRGELL